MSHAQSLLFLYSTSSAHSTRTPIQTSLLFPSHGDDPQYVATFGPLAESNTLTETTEKLKVLPTQLIRSPHCEMELTRLYLAQQHNLGRGFEGPPFPSRHGEFVVLGVDTYTCHTLS